MNRFVFVDECHFGTPDFSRRNGRAPGGNVAFNTNFNLSRKTYSLFCAMMSTKVPLHRWLSVSEDGQTANTVEFISYMRELSEHVPKCSIIVLDNARIHRSDEAMEFYKTISQRVVFLPPYSPDYNPIEFIFGEVKKALKSYYGDHRYLPDIVDKIVRELTLEQFSAFFGHCSRLYKVEEEEPLRPE